MHSLLKHPIAHWALLILCIFLLIRCWTAIPEHCAENSQATKLILESKNIKATYEDKNENIICFKTNDPTVIKEILEHSQDNYLKLQQIDYELKEKKWNDIMNWISKYLIWIVLAGIVSFTIIKVTKMFTERY